MVDRNYALGEFPPRETDYIGARETNKRQKEIDTANDRAGVWPMGDFEVYRDPTSEFHQVRLRRKDGKPIPEKLTGLWTNMTALKKRLEVLNLI